MFEILPVWWGVAAALALGLLGVGYRLGSRAGSAARAKAESQSTAQELYFRGLNFLLTDEPDKAIEEFVKVVRINSETVEIYLSLGNLFRARGEVGRAIRIHQNIIARPNLSPETRTAALFALAEDYRQGGFVDRASEAYRQVLAVDPDFRKALEGLLILHESEGRWGEAFNVQKRLEQVTKRPDPRREAHLRLKVGREALKEGRQELAMDEFRAAIKAFPGCVEAYRLLGEEQMAAGKVRAAIKSFAALKRTRPSHFFMLVDPLHRAYRALNDEEGFEKCLREAVAAPVVSVQLLSYWSRWLAERGLVEEAVSVLTQGLERHLGSTELTTLLVGHLCRLEKWPEARDAALRCLDHLSARQHNFQCSQCGFMSRDVYWKCPQCHHWDTLEPV